VLHTQTNVLGQRGMAGALTDRFSPVVLSVLLLKSFSHLQIYTQ